MYLALLDRYPTFYLCVLRFFFVGRGAIQDMYRERLTSRFAAV